MLPRQTILNGVMSYLSDEVIVQNKRFLLGIMVALMLVVAIFGFSTQSGTESNQLSLSITDKVIKELEARGVLPEPSSEDRLNVNLVIRKVAHGTLYGLLAAMVFGVVLGIVNARSRKPWRAVVYTLVLVLLIACVDEWRQNFTGRHGTPVDVGIDMVGAVVGILIIAIYSRCRRT